MLNNSLSNNKNSWLVGDTQTLADWALWTFVRQFRLADPIAFDNDNEIIALRYWLEYFTHHEKYPILMTKFKPWIISDKDEIFPP